MNRPRRTTLPTPGALPLGRLTWGAIAMCVAAALAIPSRARADPVILPDPTASAEQAELAGAVSLLVRSYLKPGERPLVPRRELGLAIQALTGRPPGKTLTVPADQARRLLDRLAAEGLVLWDLDTSKKGISVSGTLLGRGGRRMLRIHGTAATGDVSKLALQLAKKLAPALGTTVADNPPDVGLAELRPFVAVDVALLSDDAVSAARAAELAQPKIAERVSGAKEVLRALAEDASLPALPRVQARLLRGEWAMAADIADGGLAREPRNVPLRAARVRALAALKDFARAEQELAHLKGTRNLTALALAQVSLAIERDDPQAKKDEALAPLLGRPAGEWRAVLPIIAATPPGTFGARVEAAALAAAEKLSLREPGIASTLAARALAGGAGARQTAYLIDVHELSSEQIKALSVRLTAEAADASSAALSEKIKAREEEAKELEEADAGPQKPTGPPSTLAVNLLPVLQRFDALYEPSLSAIQIAPLPGSGEPFYWPFFVRKHNLANGLLEALMRTPWELRATRAKMDTEILPEDRFSDEGIASLAHDLGSGALLLYRIRPAGLAPWVKIELVLHDSASQKTERLEASLVGRSTGLVMLNPLVVVVTVLAFLAALGWAIVISFRGAIQVRVQWDADAKDELFSILISKTPKTPTIENIALYRKKLEWRGGGKRRFEAWKIDQNTTFRGIPRGKWYVHLYGIFTRGRQTMLLHEPPEEVEVLPRKTAFVAHVLEAAEAEFRIKVIDDAGPVEGARVWIDEEHGKPVVTGKDGCATFKVPKGYHVIHAVTRGMAVERPYHVVKAKLHEFTINLVWERRQESVSRALERQTDDAEQYMSRSMRKNTGSFPAVAPEAGVRSPTGSYPAVAPAPSAPSASEAVPVAADSEIVDLTPVPSRPAPAPAPRRPTGQVVAPPGSAAHPSPARSPAPAQPPGRPAMVDPQLPASFGPPPASAPPAVTARGLPVPGPSPATARGLPAPGPAAATVTRATVSLKPLAPQPAQPAGPAARKTTGQVAVPSAQPAAPTEDAPVDLDMSGAHRARPAAPPAASTGAVRKPTR